MTGTPIRQEYLEDVLDWISQRDGFDGDIVFGVKFICGYIYEGSELPDDYTCPTCGHPKEDFEPIYE